MPAWTRASSSSVNSRGIFLMFGISLPFGSVGGSQADSRDSFRSERREDQAEDQANEPVIKDAERLEARTTVLSRLARGDKGRLPLEMVLGVGEVHPEVRLALRLVSRHRHEVIVHPLI